MPTALPAAESRAATDVPSAEIRRLADPESETVADGDQQRSAADAPSEVASESIQVPPDLSDMLRRLDALEMSASSNRLGPDTSGREQTAKPPRDEGSAPGSAKASDAGASVKRDDAWLDVSGEKWTVKLGGHVQGDLINWATASAAIVDAKDYFEFRRLRLVADGTGYGICDFRLQMTLEPETVGTNPPGVVTSPDVKDAYFSMNEIPWLGRFRIGNFFVPFSLEQVTNDTNNAFLERSIPTQGVFAVDREVGIAFYNSNDDHSITWTYGVFIDSISEALKERIDDNQGTRVSGRLTWLPYYDEPSQGRYLVHTGVGVLYTDDYDNLYRLRTRPQIREGPFLIDTGPLGASSYTTGNLEAAVVWGQFAVQSEAFLSTVSLTAGDERTASGAYVHATYFLTGENRIFERFGQHGAQFARNVPTSNFFIVPGGVSPGAWEVKGRWSYLDVDQLDAGIYNDFTFGFNWYWSDRTRIMFDWIHPITSSQAVFGATQSNILAMRFDFNW